MKKNLIISFAIGALIVLISGYLMHQNMHSKQHQFYSNKYELLTKLRKNAVKVYFETVKGELLFWSQSSRVKEASVELTEAWLEFDTDPKAELQRLYRTENPYKLGERRKLHRASDNSDYSDAHERFHTLGTELVEKRGYYDFFLIDELGNIIYSVEKESDFATNLAYGKYADSGLGSVFAKVIQDQEANTHIVDFRRYAPSNDDPAVFMARRLVDDDQITIGVVAVQLDIKEIAKIMLFSGGVGETGETYLVGEDKLMRSNSRFSDQETMLSTEVNTLSVSHALNQKSGVAIDVNYRGQKSLSAYDSFSLGDFRWAVISEISLTEINASNPVSKTFMIIGAAITMLIGLLGTLLSAVIRRNDSGAESEFLGDISGD